MEDREGLRGDATDARAFCALASAWMCTAWAAFSLGGGADFHRRGLSCPLATRPPWLPAPWLAALLRSPRTYLALCHGAPLFLGLVAASDLHPQRGQSHLRSRGALGVQ